jgi:type I restriction enzyme S subunit
MGDEYPFIEMDAVRSDHRYVRSPSLRKYDSSSFSKFADQDVLLARITPCLENGKIAQVRMARDEAGFGSTEFFVFRAKPKVLDPSFLFYLSKSDLIWKNAVNSMVGASGRQRADATFLKKLSIRLPDVPTQQKIAAVLAAYDDLIEANRRRIALLERMAEEIYREWFVRLRFPSYQKSHFRKGLPAEWTQQSVGQLVDRLGFGRLYHEAELAQTGTVVVIDQSTAKFLGFYEGDPQHKASIDAPILLFGDHTCKMCFMTKPFSLAENVVPFRPIPGLSAYFLFHLIKGLAETTEYKRHWSELTNRPVLRPTVALSELFEEQVRPLHAQVDLLVDSHRNLQRTRDLLLPRLISGKLPVEALPIAFPPSMAEATEATP